MNLLNRASDRLKLHQSRKAIDADILRTAKAVAKASPKTGGKQIVSFNASTRITGLSLNAAFAMLTGWSLRLQGVEVINFVCQRGMTRCVLGTDQNDVKKLPPCRQCVKQSAVIYSHANVVRCDFYPSPDLAEALQDADLSVLRHFNYEGLPLGDLCLPSMRWILRRHHLIDDEPTRILYRHYILSAFKVAMQFERMLLEKDPHTVLVFNGMQFPEATARFIARRFGLPVVSHEVGLLPFSAFFTEGDATAYPVNIPADFQLTDAQNQRLDAYLSKRFKGDFSMAGVQFWPEMSGLGEAFIEKMNTFKQVVPIFTNVIFDTSQPHANVLFPHMFDWLDKILETIKQHPETLFVIRAHPDESRPGKASRESVTAWVQDQGADQLDNLVFVNPDEYFSSYEMIQRAKFVMIYNSTIGMESSIMGMPVLCAGKARFTQLETVFFPATQDAYMAQLEEFLSAERIEISPVHQNNARRFLYYQLYRTSLPFDDYLEPDGIWPGFVRLKPFAWQDLLPEHSNALRVISEGMLEGKEFLLPEDEDFR